MNKELKRALITLIVFIGLVFLLPLLIKFKGYDVYVQAICMLAAVIGAGCYWIGSRNIDFIALYILKRYLLKY